MRARVPRTDCTWLSLWFPVPGAASPLAYLAGPWGRLISPPPPLGRGVLDVGARTAGASPQGRRRGVSLPGGPSVFSLADAISPTSSGVRGNHKVRMGTAPRATGRRASPGVVRGSLEVQRDVGLVADDPAVMGLRRNVEQRAGGELDLPAIAHRGHGAAGDDHADVLDFAEVAAGQRPDVGRPAPSGLVLRAADRQATEAHEVEAPLLGDAGFVRVLETLEDQLDHDSLPSRSSLRSRVTAWPARWTRSPATRTRRAPPREDAW